MFNLTGCSLLPGHRNSLIKYRNNINIEIIKNYSKAISRDPYNFLFYLERGRAKDEYGDFIGAINDFNYAFKINPDYRILFHRANTKYKYGDFNGAV